MICLIALMVYILLLSLLFQFFFKEFVYFLYDYFEHFKLKDSSFIQETNKCEDTIKNLNKDNESGESSNTENKPSEASNTENKPSEASGSGFHTDKSLDDVDIDGNPIGEDLRNYQIDSDTDFDPADYGFMMNNMEIHIIQNQKLKMIKQESIVL